MISEAEKKRLVTGYKQTAKALKAGRAEKVLIAQDCEDRLSEEIKSSAVMQGACILYIDTMRSLGEMCGITLKASCACILKS